MSSVNSNSATKRKRRSNETAQAVSLINNQSLQRALDLESNVFKQIEQLFGVGCFTRPLTQDHVFSLLQHQVKSADDSPNMLDRVVQDGLVFVQAGKQRIYEVAEALFTMALLCFKCDADTKLHRSLISKIIRLQMEAVSLVTEAGWPWTRQLSISRWFTFLSSAPEDRQMQSLYPGEETADHVSALSYYLTGAKDVVFRLPFRVIEGFDMPSLSSPNDAAIHVPDGFALRDVQLFDFPIRRSQDNSTMTPLGLACQAVAPSIVMVLLQQGAAPVLFQAGLTETPLGSLTEPLTVIFRMLNKSRTWREWDIGGIHPSMLESLRTQERSIERTLSKCLELLLRTITNIPVQFYKKTDEKVLEKCHGIGKDARGKITFFLLEYYRHLIPVDRLNCPPTLQHLCRLRVRRILCQSKHLPDEIDSLPITWLLVPYLKLLY